MAIVVVPILHHHRPSIIIVEEVPIPMMIPATTSRNSIGNCVDSDYGVMMTMAKGALLSTIRRRRGTAAIRAVCLIGSGVKVEGKNRE